MKALINYKISIVFDSKDFAPEFHYETPEQNYEDFFSIECQIILLSPFECGIVTPIA
jgi:trehalose-6-phosphatase